MLVRKVDFLRMFGCQDVKINISTYKEKGFEIPRVVKEIVIDKNRSKKYSEIIEEYGELEIDNIAATDFYKIEINILVEENWWKEHYEN